jgi:hypothetical protein
MRSRIVHLQNGHMAIRRVAANGEQLLLTVPALHSLTPPAVRTQVFELVIRGLFGEALDLATSTADVIERKEAERQRLAKMMAETPHRNQRGLAVAA